MKVILKLLLSLLLCTFESSLADLCLKGNFSLPLLVLQDRLFIVCSRSDGTVVHSPIVPLFLKSHNVLYLFQFLLLRQSLAGILHQVASSRLLDLALLDASLNASSKHLVLLLLVCMLATQILLMSQQGQLHAVLHGCAIQLPHVIHDFVVAHHHTRVHPIAQSRP